MPDTGLGPLYILALATQQIIKIGIITSSLQMRKLMLISFSMITGPNSDLDHWLLVSLLILFSQELAT